MAVYSMGTILKKCRESKGITQEELCYGICTASALSKMEHGMREPSYVKFASLMERMGEWPEAYDIFIGDKVYQIHELERKVRIRLYHQKMSEAVEALDELERELGSFPEETIYHQFLGMGRVICRAEGKMCRAQVTELTDLLKWTVPHFGGKPLRECFLSHQELILINNIAIGYGEMGNMQKAVGLLRELKEYLECSYRENREIATMHATVLLNLVKYLGLGQQYEEALTEAQNAICVLAESGKTLKVAVLHYDLAWIYMKIDSKKYYQKIVDELSLSLCADISNRNYHSADMTIQLIEKNGKELLDSPNLHNILALYRRTVAADSRIQTPCE